MAYVATGGQNGSEAVRQAGYAGNAHVISQTAYELLRMPKILQAIREECRRLDDEALPFARMQLMKILMNENHEKHFEALKWFHGVLGISPVTKSESRKVVEHTVDGSAIEKLKRLTSLTGIDPRKLIDVTPIALSSPDEEPIEW